jgi:membrane protease YdiL (CAAX protease family)
MTPSRFTRLEDPGTDFPYYNDSPVPISNRQWLWVMAMVVLGFLVLVLPVSRPEGPWGSFIPAVLMPVIPLATLAHVARKHWVAIFGTVGRREVKLMLGFALLNVVASMSIGVVVHALTEVTPNGSIAQLAGMDAAGRTAFFAKTIPQLLGEEVITLLPFLALLQWLHRHVGLGRRAAIVGAWGITSVLFGLMHLPTYDWNLIQCIVVIGSARMVLTLPWIMTKNIWVSTGAHIVNDWLLLGLGLVGTGLVRHV